MYPIGRLVNLCRGDRRRRVPSSGRVLGCSHDRRRPGTHRRAAILAATATTRSYGTRCGVTTGPAPGSATARSARPGRPGVVFVRSTRRSWSRLVGESGGIPAPRADRSRWSAGSARPGRRLGLPLDHHPHPGNRAGAGGPPHRADHPALSALIDDAFPTTSSRPGDATVVDWYGIWDADRLVACGADRSRGDIGFLAGLTVARDRRGRGLGAALTAGMTRALFTRYDHVGSASTPTTSPRSGSTAGSASPAPYGAPRSARLRPPTRPAAPPGGRRRPTRPEVRSRRRPSRSRVRLRPARSPAQRDRDVAGPGCGRGGPSAGPQAGR